jgi:hypothetical protein
MRHLERAPGNGGPRPAPDQPKGPAGPGPAGTRQRRNSGACCSNECAARTTRTIARASFGSTREAERYRRTGTCRVANRPSPSSARSEPARRRGTAQKNRAAHGAGQGGVALRHPHSPGPGQLDPAIDVACLAHWHGWPTIGRTVDAATYARARTWSGTFALEQIVKTLLDGPTTARSVPASNRSSDGWTATAATERGTPPVNISYELHSICCCQRSPVAASL